MGTGLLIRKTEKLKLERALMASQCTFFFYTNNKIEAH